MRVPLAVIVTTLAVTSSGCAHAPEPPSAAKVEHTLRDLKVDPDKLLFERFTATSPVTGQVSNQVLIIAPADNGRYRIIDSHGDIYDNYDDFLRNNTLPDQPGPPT